MKLRMRNNGQQPPQVVELPAGNPRPRASITSGMLLTVIAWLLCRATVGATWVPAWNPFTFTPDLWIRWDSFNYLSIAVQGRTFGRCTSPDFSTVPNPFLLEWCGTAGWLPGYPLFMQAIGSTGLALPDAGLLFSWMAMATAMFLVWCGWGRELPAGRALILLLLFGLFPGSVYNFAVFPTSTALACVVSAILAANTERFFIAALLMTVAGLCYPSAWLAAAGLAAGLVVIAIPFGYAVVSRRALWGLAGMGSLVVLGLHDQFALDGRFDAYYQMQLQSGVQPKGFPGRDFFGLILAQNTIEQKRIGGFSGAVLAVQGLAAVLSAGAAATIASVAWRRNERDVFEIYPMLVGITVIVGLLLMPNVAAWNRSVVLAAPCVVCLRRLPMPWLCAVAVVMGITTAILSRAFFNNSMI